MSMTGFRGFSRDWHELRCHGRADHDFAIGSDHQPSLSREASHDSLKFPGLVCALRNALMEDSYKPVPAT